MPRQAVSDSGPRAEISVAAVLEQAGTQANSGSAAAYGRPIDPTTRVVEDDGEFFSH